jgi:hypothetical protein
MKTNVFVGSSTASPHFVTKSLQSMSQTELLATVLSRIQEIESVQNRTTLKINILQRRISRKFDLPLSSLGDNLLDEFEDINEEQIDEIDEDEEITNDIGETSAAASTASVPSAEASVVSTSDIDSTTPMPTNTKYSIESIDKLDEFHENFIEQVLDNGNCDEEAFLLLGNIESFCSQYTAKENTNNHNNDREDNIKTEQPQQQQLGNNSGCENNTDSNDKMAIDDTQSLNVNNNINVNKSDNNDDRENNNTNFNTTCTINEFPTPSTSGNNNFDNNSFLWANINSDKLFISPQTMN